MKHCPDISTRARGRVKDSSTIVFDILDDYYCGTTVHQMQAVQNRMYPFQTFYLVNLVMSMAVLDLLAPDSTRTTVSRYRQAFLTQLRGPSHALRRCFLAFLCGCLLPHRISRSIPTIDPLRLRV